MGSFVVFLSEEESLEKRLKEMARKEDLKKTVLSIDDKTGPERYKIAKDADVTVVLHADHQVKSNFAFNAGELKDKDVEKIVAELPKILPAK